MCHSWTLEEVPTNVIVAACRRVLGFVEVFDLQSKGCSNHWEEINGMWGGGEWVWSMGSQVSGE